MAFCAIFGQRACVDAGGELGRWRGDELIMTETLAPISAAKYSQPESEVVNVAFGVDSNYVSHMSAVIASVVRAAPDALFHFIVLSENVAPERRAKAEAVAPGARFTWVELGADDIPGFSAIEGHHDRSMLFRLGLERLAPAECKRIIYLDADIIVMGDLRELWVKDLGEHAIGAVADSWTKPDEFAQLWGLTPETNYYFNSGIMLIDLERVRRERLFTKTLEFTAANPGKLQFGDQDALNCVIWGQWTPIGTEWNVQAIHIAPWHVMHLPEHQRFTGIKPRIVHFTGKEKPWIKGMFHPWAWLYWSNLARTPFVAEVAKRHGVTPLGRARMWLRWLRRRPRRGADYLLGQPHTS
jgi:lipopolysaccharide biosynthesis glycosyltransferase